MRLFMSATSGFRGRFKMSSHFADAKNLEAITPSWLGFRILSPEPIAMRSGANRLQPPLARVSRALGHRNSQLGSADSFVDVQLQGPYSLWHHTHSFQPVDGGTLMGDRFDMPFRLGSWGDSRTPGW